MNQTVGGPDFLQTLAQSPSAADATVTSSDPSGAPKSLKSTAGSDSDSSSDSAMMVLALLSQSLAGASSVASSAAPPAVASSGAGSEAATAAAILKSSVAQNLAPLLSNGIADTSRDPASAGATTTDSAATLSGSNTAATLSAAHLSIAPHFHLDAGSTTADLSARVGTPAWTEELGTHLTWMTHQGIESAALRLSPEHLGPLDIRISVQHGQASVWFGATQPDTRAALDQALPRLRELFASQGMTLADANVSRDAPRGRQHPPAVPAIAAMSGVASDETPSTRSLGLLDTYA